MKNFTMIIAALLLAGCLPEVPDGAACTPIGFVMEMSPEANPLDWTTWSFVLNDEGAALQCDFG